MRLLSLRFISLAIFVSVGVSFVSRGSGPRPRVRETERRQGGGRSKKGTVTGSTRRVRTLSPTEGSLGRVRYRLETPGTGPDRVDLRLVGSIGRIQGLLVSDY